MQIACAASRLVAYDNRYFVELAVSSILRWNNEVIEKVKEGVNTNSITSKSLHFPTKYVDQIKNKYLGYIHTLYHQEIKIKGPKTSLCDLAIVWMSSAMYIMNYSQHLCSIDFNWIDGFVAMRGVIYLRLGTH